MTVRTILKLVFLVIMTICAAVSMGAGLFVSRKNKKSKKYVSPTRTVVRIRMFCFLGMLISLFICIII